MEQHNGRVLSKFILKGITDLCELQAPFLGCSYSNIWSQWWAIWAWSSSPRWTPGSKYPCAFSQIPEIYWSCLFHNYRTQDISKFCCGSKYNFLLFVQYVASFLSCVHYWWTFYSVSSVLWPLYGHLSSSALHHYHVTKGVLGAGGNPLHLLHIFFSSGHCKDF